MLALHVVLLLLSAPVAADSLGNLPLKVVPAASAPAQRLAVLFTGDGGWAAIDKELSDSLSAHGALVVAVNSREYFSSQRTPDGAAQDLDRIIRHYESTLAARSLVLVGYSRGANVLPFLVTRLPADLLAQTRVVALLAPAVNANFRFHLVDLISNHRRKDDLMTVPEIERIHGPTVLCVYGDDETDSACPLVKAGTATVIDLPGGHHFDRKYGEIASRILAAIGS